MVAVKTDHDLKKSVIGGRHFYFKKNESPQKGLIIKYKLILFFPNLLATLTCTLDNDIMAVQKSKRLPRLSRV